MNISKASLAVIILSSIVLGESVFFVKFTLDYNNLNALYATTQVELTFLQNTYQNLNSTYNSLVLNYDSLQRNYTSLYTNYVSTVSSYQILQGDYNSLRLTYNNLQQTYNSLQVSYNDLQSDYEIENMLRIGNSLESYYDYVRINQGPQWWWSNQQKCIFAANLALHSLGRNCWPTIENEFYSIVGRRSYDIAKQKLIEIVNFIGLQSGDTAVNNIRKILQFLDLHIQYQAEIDDYYLSPIETLGIKSGDCDDFTILAAALFEKIGIDAAFGIFKNDENEYHAEVLVHLTNLGDYEYWYYSDLTQYGLASGKWIKIEPQYTIENQISDWIGQWDLIAVASLN